jgi:hypothetical protein
MRTPRSLQSLAASATMPQRFAVEVRIELKNEIPTQFRANRTSQGNRGASRALPSRRTSVVTAQNTRATSIG